MAGRGDGIYRRGKIRTWSDCIFAIGVIVGGLG